MKNTNLTPQSPTFFKKIKAGFVRNILILILVSFIVVLSVMLINLSSTVEFLAKSLINRTTDRTELELNNFFGTVNKNLLILQQWGKNGSLNLDSTESINKQLLPVFESYPQMTNIIIANTDGKEYILYRKDSFWVTRTIHYLEGKRKIQFTKWVLDDHKEINLLKKWEEKELTYDPRERPWFKGALQLKDPQNPFWTDPYIFHSSQQPGITVSSKWNSRQNPTQTNVIAIDIQLTEVSKFTANMQISENGKVFIATKNMKLVGLPYDKKFSNIDSLKASILLTIDQANIEALHDAMKSWEKHKKIENEAFTFNSHKEHWWSRFQKFPLGSNQFFYIAVAIPESDFLTEVKNTKNAILGGFILVVVFISIIMRSYYQKKKANELLAQKNSQIMAQKHEIEKAKDEIEEKNKEIIDSINYAQYIQSALIPSVEEVTEVLPDNFVLFLPKDIVSGDFYWMTHRGDETIIVAADCTGHGVPGAFMSMLGISILNEIANISNVADITTEFFPANKILNMLRRKVIKSLHQTGEAGKSKDGMDIALCIVNKKEKKLQYAGANNPLYLIRNGELLETKADRMPIGIHDKSDVPFTNNEIDLQDGDTFYIFSDGYADQFGGPKEKKFKSKTMKKLLVDINDKPMSEQREIIYKTHLEWRDKVPQIDDIILIGVKMNF